MSAQKISRQGLTWRHVGVVITMCLTLFTAVGIIFTAAGLCYRPLLNTLAYRRRKYHSTLPSYT